MVVANWKMNPGSLAEAREIFSFTKKAASKLRNTDVVVCPPFPFLQPLSRLERPKNLSLGAQNISVEEKGAFTGEVSASMLTDLGVKYSIIGHSERRAMGESNEIVKRKLERAFDNNIIPILCMGEKERNREGVHLEFLRNQVKECLTSIQKKNLLGLLIAYEPVWAIGKSYKESMNATDVHETTLFIKKSVGEIFGKDVADSIFMLYGGSVEEENALEIIKFGNVDGFLAGHASLAKIEFPKILANSDIKR